MQSIGIDFGTSYSRVAVIERGNPKVIENTHGEKAIPSIVAFTEDGEVLVGQPAKRQAVTNPSNTIFAVKRLLGRRFDDPATRKAATLLPYSVVRGPNGDAWVRAAGKDLAPAQIAAFILRELKESAERYLGGPVTQAVVAVPAYFDNVQRRATRDALTIAGLEVLRFINEPSAAALGMGEKGREGKTIAVYDLGGGSFDISLLEMGDGVFEVKSTHGDAFLGGEDFDDRLVDLLADEFMASRGMDLREDRLALRRLKDMAERAKIELSALPVTEINLPFIAADSSGPAHLVREVRRVEFERLVTDLVQRTLEPCRKALADAEIDAADLSEVVLVGGMTSMPLVRSAVAEFFGKEPESAEKPDEVVALGAALQAGTMQGEVQDHLLLDVTPLSIGIETLGGVFTRMIERNTSIPTKKAQTFSTAEDNQNAVTIRVYQGERDMAAENKLLGQFDLVGLPPAPRGVPQIEVSFEIDSNAMLRVTARDKQTGAEQQIRIQASGGLTDAQIEKMIEDAEQFAEDDRERRAAAEARNNADALVHSTERQLKERRDAVPSRIRKEVEEALRNTRDAIDRGDTATIQAAGQKLVQTAMALGQVASGRESAARAPAAIYTGEITEVRTRAALWLFSDRDTDFGIACQIPDEGREDPRFTITWSTRAASVESLCGSAYDIATAIDTRMATLKLFEEESRFTADVSSDDSSQVIDQLRRRVEQEIGRHRFCRFEFARELDPRRNDSFLPVAIIWFDVDRNGAEDAREVGIMLADSILDDCQWEVAQAIGRNHDHLVHDQAVKFVEQVKPRVRRNVSEGVFAE